MFIVRGWVSSSRLISTEQRLGGILGDQRLNWKNNWIPRKIIHAACNKTIPQTNTALNNLRKKLVMFGSSQSEEESECEDSVRGCSRDQREQKC